MRYIRRLLVAVLVLVLLLLAVLYFFLGTSLGLSTVLRFVPNLQVAQVQGSLLGGLQLQQLRFQQTGVDAQVERLTLDWQPLALLQAKAHINQLWAEGVQLALSPQPAAAEPAPPPSAPLTALPDIQLPLEVAIDEVLIRDLRVQQAANTLNLQQLRLALHSQDGRLQVDDLNVQQFSAQDVQLVQAQLQAQVDLQTPHALSLKLDATARQPQAGAVALQMQAQGDPSALVVDVQVQLADSQRDAPIQLAVQSKLQHLLAHLHWQAELKLQGVDSQHSTLQAFLQDVPPIQATTEITAHGDLTHAQATLTLHTQVAEFGTFNLHLSGQNLGDNWQQWQLQDLTLRQTDADLALHVQGEVDLRQAQPQIDAQIDWQAVRFPLQGKALLAASPSGKLTFAGTPDAYQVTLDTQVQAKDAPDSHWTLQATGSTQAAKIKQLRGELLDGWLQLSGDVGWQPQPVWDIRLDSENINPGKQWSEFPGKLALALHSAGQLDGAAVKASIEGLRLQGRLRDYPLSVLVDANIDNKDYKIKQLRLQSGKTQVQVQGQIQGEKVGLDWQIAAPNLQALYPQAQGSLSGAGTVGGQLTRPLVQATLHGRDLRFENNQLNRLDLTANVDVSPQGQMNLDLTAKGLQADAAQLDSLSLQAQGSMAAHRVNLTARLPQQSAELGLTGGVQNMDSWQGMLQVLKLQDAQWGSVALQKPTALLASAQQASLAQACLNLQLKQATSQLCLEGAWQAVKGGMGAAQAAVKLDEVSLDVLKPFLPNNIQLKNFATSLQLDAELLKNGELRSDLAVNLTPGEVRLRNPDQDPVTLLKHQGTTFTAKIDPQGLTAKLDLQLPQQDGIHANLHLPNLKRLPLSAEQPLDGDVKLQFTDFSLLPVFAPQVSAPKGRIEADVTLAGQMTKPLVQGELRLRDGGVKVELAGLDVHDLQLAIQGDQAGQVQLNGQLRMGEKSQGEEALLRLDGTATASADWAAQLHVKGQRLEVMNSPEIWLLASPDLHFAGNPKRMALTGEIVVPEALITPPDSQGTGKVSASSDVVVVSEQQNTQPEDNKQKKPPTLPFYTDLRIGLGDKVRVKAMGFKGRLQGDLRISGKPDKGLLGNGRVSVLDGRYKAYGQDLKIRKGQVLYSGGPLENPGLDVQAVRVVGEVTAGIDVSGTAQAPELNLFSEPTLDQTNILSYIVLGRPASGGAANANQQQMLAQALSDLALNEDSSVATALRDDLGLDTVGLDTSGGAEQSAFMLGKYLTPDLYISYGVGLFDAENVFRMRYRLSPHFSLESATSGGNSGVDLHYTLER